MGGGFRGSITHHALCQLLSQHKRKLLEQACGWLKVIAGLRESRFLGRARTELYGLMAMSAYDLTRMARLRPLPI